METLVANLSGSIRRTTRNGCDYIVAPLTLIVPGVLNGSQGSLFYPQEELAKNVDAWNGIPLVVSHPRDADGKAVSARSPKVLDAQEIGTVFNTKVNGKLTAEGWFDVEKTRRIDSRVIEALEANRQMELSTGLFTQNDVAPQGAENDGIPYSFIARNYRPDHLAVLLDEKGACSIEDGCGVNVNTKGLSHGDVRQQLQNAIQVRYGKESYIVDIFDSSVVYEAGERLYEVKYAIKAGKGVLSDAGALEVRRTTSYKPVVNAATKSEGGRPFPARDFAYVPDRNKPSTWKLRLTNVPGGSPDARIVGAAVAALGKGFRGNKVQIPSGALAAVKAKVRTAWLEANPGKSKEDVPRILINKKESPMRDEKREEIVNDLIANTCCWEEDDRETLNGFSDAKLKAMDEHAEEQEQREAVANAAMKEFIDASGTKHVYSEKDRKWESKVKETEEEVGRLQLVANEKKEPTEEEWMKAAPASVQEDLAFARNEKRKQKTAIVEGLVTNVKDEQEQARLTDRFMKKDLEDLQDMTALVPEQKPTANYAGASTPGMVAENAEKNFARFGLPDEYIPDEKS